MSLGNLIFQAEVVEQGFRAVVLPHHDQQASDDRNQTEHRQLLSSSMLLLSLNPQITVTFSTPTPVLNSYEFPAFGACAKMEPMAKRLIRGAIKAVALLAVAVFVFARMTMTTNTGLLLFVGSIVVLLVCFGLLKFLEGDDDNTGYWPPNRKA